MLVRESVERKETKIGGGGWKVILAKIGSVEDERNKRINIREGKKEKKKTGNPTIICSHLFLRKTLLCAALSFLRELCSRLHSRVPCSLL